MTAPATSRRSASSSASTAKAEPLPLRSMSPRQPPPPLVGTRGSPLALRQTQLVIDRLRALQPGLPWETRVIRTEGDRDRTTPMARLSGTGAFVKELELALAPGEIDLAVHSLKDLPSRLASG